MEHQFGAIFKLTILTEPKELFSGTSGDEFTLGKAGRWLSVVWQGGIKMKTFHENHEFHTE